MLPVALFFIQFRLCIADDIFRKVTNIDCTVNILQQQDRLRPCEVLYLKAVLQRLVSIPHLIW